MGMERIVTFTGPPPSWASILKEIPGMTVTIRMIDGLPAFPDEMPEDGWKELRVSTPGGMLTLRQEPGRLKIVAWGNADEELRQQWDAIARACVAATKGTLDDLKTGGPM